MSTPSYSILSILIYIFISGFISHLLIFMLEYLLVFFFNIIIFGLNILIESIPLFIGFLQIINYHLIVSIVILFVITSIWNKMEYQQLVINSNMAIDWLTGIIEYYFSYFLIIFNYVKSLAIGAVKESDIIIKN